jgi:hypothetical protein
VGQCQLSARGKVSLKEFSSIASYAHYILGQRIESEEHALDVLLNQRKRI